MRCSDPADYGRGAMRLALCFLLLVAGCSYPELAYGPDAPTGAPPPLVPLGSLMEETAEPDAEADAALEARAAALRARAAALPADGIEPETRAAMEAAGRR